MPNYPKMEIFPGYKGRLFVQENEQSLTVFRSFIYVRKNLGSVGRVAQLLLVCYKFAPFRMAKDR